MAENRNVKKNTPVKKKRKLNAKGRTVVRRSIAGVLLASALIVASLPSDKSGSAKAEGEVTAESLDPLKLTYENINQYNPALSYLVDLKNAVSVNIADMPNLSKPEGLDRWSYIIKDVGNENYSMFHRFQYHEQYKSGILNGIITGFDKGSGLDANFLVPYRICGSYLFYTDTDYKAVTDDYTTSSYVVTDPSQAAKMYDKNDSYVRDVNRENMFNYFGSKDADFNFTEDEVESIVTSDYLKTCSYGNYIAVYDLYVSYLRNNTVSGNNHTPTYEECCQKKWPKDPRTFEGKNISADALAQIVFDKKGTKIPGSTTTDKYTLVNVGIQNLDTIEDPADQYKILIRKNGAQYSDEYNDNSNIPDDSVWVVRYIPDNKNTEFMDSNGFVYARSAGITSIGEYAFGTDDKLNPVLGQQVGSVEIDDKILYIGDSAFKNSSIKGIKCPYVTYIGNDVFYGCGDLSDISIDTVKTIGSQAFYKCTSIQNLVVPSKASYIGYGAFAECHGLKTISFDDQNTDECEIGDYAFYNDNALTSIVFPEKPIKLHKASFALDGDREDSTMDFTFPSNIKSVDDELFGADVYLWNGGVVKGVNGSAVTKDSSEGEIKANCSYVSKIGDYLLANRKNLGKVTINNYDSRLPMNTFAGCKNLTKLDLNDSDQNLSKKLAFDANIFRDVQNPAMEVWGPQNGSSIYSGKDYAQPRVSTWACYGDGLSYIPYRFHTALGDHYEVSYSIDDNDLTDKVIFDLKVSGEKGSGTAAIIGSIYLGDKTKLGETKETAFSIPDSVPKTNGYQVTQLEKGGLAGIKDKIVWFKVPDGGLISLGDGVFSKCENLTGVIIGNSVESIGNECFEECQKLTTAYIGTGITSIGDNAFAKCSNLEDVYWDEPANVYNANISIGSDAFKTNADDKGKLYFHGNANSASYAPFDYAMNNKINGKTRICYMTSIPYDMSDPENSKNLTQAERDGRIQTMSIIKFQKSPTDPGKVMLINYPRFQNLPGSIQSMLSQGKYGDLVDAEKYLVGMTINVSVPPVVESIDVNAFINEHESNTDLNYLTDDEKNMYGAANASTHLSTMTLLKSSPGEETYPGLFSGNTVDTGNQMVDAINKIKWLPDDENYNVDSSRGNDWIVNLTLPGVKEIPDYCFDSCERLMSINLGDNLGSTSDSIGEYAFNDCNNLQVLDANYSQENPYLSIENMILYRHDASSDPANAAQEMIACLPARGSGKNTAGGKMPAISATNDPGYLKNITSIRKDAFNGCDNISTVDLTECSNLSKIVEGQFQDCSGINVIKLPLSLTDIGDDAFKGCDKKLTVTIPGYTSVNKKAFDENSPYDPQMYIRVQTPKEDSNGNLTAAYKCTVDSGIGPEHIHWEPMSTVHIRFFAEETKKTLLKDFWKSTEGGSVDLEDSDYPTDVIPDFAYWECEYVDRNGVRRVDQGEMVGRGIKEDRDIYAVISVPPDPTPVVYTISFYDDIGGPIGSQNVEAGFTNFMPYDYITGRQTQISGRNPADWEFDCWICYENGISKGNNAIYGATINGNWSCHQSFKQKGSASANTPTPVPSGSAPSPTIAPTGATPTTKPGATSTPTPTTAGGSSSQNNTYNGKMYYAIVENGSGSGQYPVGSVITVTAYAAPDGKTFDRWTTSNTDIGMSNILAVSTTFIMPSHDVKVTATYKSKAVSGNTISGVTPIAAPTLAPGVTATPTPIVKNNGTDVVITTDTIDNNKKNLGNASVAGSTDNFIVKITDSAAATAAVEAALRNAYGERFTDLRYAAFDISLYDSTGTYLVSNANSLAVTITMPIPEALLSYAGNNKAGAVINGQLQELATSYTTIDGVPCMRFTATHFSPYTIYVDTGHIVRGIVDNTPKTGDGIQPKWFLSGGMLSMSAVLFLWKEKNPIIAEEKRRKKKTSGR